MGAPLFSLSHSDRLRWDISYHAFSLLAAQCIDNLAIVVKTTELPACKSGQEMLANGKNSERMAILCARNLSVTFGIDCI